MNICIAPDCFLTTEHPRSNYGLPVLTIDGEAYGPSDSVPNPMQLAGGTAATAGYWVAWRLNGDVDTTPEMVEAARKFLSQWPDEQTRPGIDDVIHQDPELINTICSESVSSFFLELDAAKEYQTKFGMLRYSDDDSFWYLSKDGNATNANEALFLKATEHAATLPKVTSILIGSFLFDSLV